jgi:hypothetical protein
MPQWDTETATIEQIRRVRSSALLYETRVQLRQEVITAIGEILQSRTYGERDRISSCLRVLQEFSFFLDFEKKVMEVPKDGPPMSWHSARMAIDGRDE